LQGFRSQSLSLCGGSRYLLLLTSYWNQGRSIRQCRERKGARLHIRDKAPDRHKTGLQAQVLLTPTLQESGRSSMSVLASRTLQGETSPTCQLRLTDLQTFAIPYRSLAQHGETSAHACRLTKASLAERCEVCQTEHRAFQRERVHSQPVRPRDAQIGDVCRYRQQKWSLALHDMSRGGRKLPRYMYRDC
jgi:hypothetical protein